jgi:pyruvate/2-oxoglutarate dehydrogenase complex dihydrolipoamide dehydrogenase (E3) component
MLVRGTTLLKGEDSEAVDLLESALVDDGVKICRSVTVTQVDYDAASSQFTVRTSDGSFLSEALLLATGRAPNVEGLDLEKANVQYSPTSGIVVNDYLQSSNAHIYAAGDCCTDYKFTHAADFQARTVLRNALFFGNAKNSNLLIPWCT